MVNGVKKRKRTRTGEECKLNCEEWIIYTTEKQAEGGTGAGVTWEIVELTTHATNKRQAPHFEGTAVKALDKGTMGCSSWRRSSSLLLSTATDWVKDERQGGGTSKTAHRYALWMGLYLYLHLSGSPSSTVSRSLPARTHINYLKLIHNIFYFHLTKAQMASNQFGQAQGAGAGAVCSINPQAGEGFVFFIFVVFWGMRQVWGSGNEPRRATHVLAPEKLIASDAINDK